MLTKENTTIKFETKPVYRFINIKPEYTFSTLKKVGQILNNELQNEQTLKLFIENGEVLILTKNDTLIGYTYLKDGKYFFLRGEKSLPISDQATLKVFYEFLKTEGRDEDFLKAVTPAGQERYSIDALFIYHENGTKHREEKIHII